MGGRVGRQGEWDPAPDGCGDGCVRRVLCMHEEGSGMTTSLEVPLILSSRSACLLSKKVDRIKDADHFQKRQP